MIPNCAKLRQAVIYCGAMFNAPLTKRQLGVFLLIGGILAVLGILAVDVIDAGRDGGIGPTQRIALGLALALALLGLTLIPLGDDPA
jgi:hypothetical protein